MRELERRYPQELQVISVHSPKFPTERETANLRQAVLRHRIEHPVLNDADFQLWKQYDTRAWPTLFFIDPKGNVIGRHEGELTADITGEVLDGWLAEYRRANLLTGAPWTCSVRRARTAPSPSPARSSMTPPASASSSPTPTTTESSSRAWTAKWSA